MQSFLFDALCNPRLCSAQLEQRGGAVTETVSSGGVKEKGFLVYRIAALVTVIAIKSFTGKKLA